VASLELSTLLLRGLLSISLELPLGTVLGVPARRGWAALFAEEGAALWDTI
jgi:hypothetical protein